MDIGTLFLAAALQTRVVGGRTWPPALVRPVDLMGL
jgi:hypothetical protein